MTADELWRLIEALEAHGPFDETSLARFFATTLERRKDHSKRPILVGTSEHFEITLMPRKGIAPLLELLPKTPIVLDAGELQNRFPDGGWVPPPPPLPGVPADAAGSYWADRPWGQVWFRFLSGDRMNYFAMNPGGHGSPGV